MTPDLKTIQSVRPAVYEPHAPKHGDKAQPLHAGRVIARGKFLYLDGEKYFIRGVTYGPFRPDSLGSEYKTLNEVEGDFAAMAQAGINTVRTYTSVPPWLLDCAARHGLKVLIGIAWPQHVTFLDDPKIRRGIEVSVRETIRSAAGHRAVLGYTIGNEIPASIVRWYGARRIERFVGQLFDAAKEEDPAALITYVNYPTTGYLRMPFLDFLCFNVYLEERRSLTSYINRLHNIAEDKPVVLGEVGLDSMRNGADVQGATLEWQIERAFTSGCAGVCVFAWTDEWHRGGADIDDWAFGLTDRERRPKPALERVARAFRTLPFPDGVDWPRISVVVCTFNGSRHIRETCEALQKLDYPNCEVIIVSDGSTDGTLGILSDFDFEVISIENGGLSRARNVGLQRAQGEIVAYLDDDAYPDKHWLKYLAWSFMKSKHDGIGGPNFPPPDDDFYALCVAHSPGGPNHVLLADDLAEHIPGCNMAFRRSALERVGGFDRDFRIAGDDVDLCWKIQEYGGTLGFSPAAVVWHHRRSSISAYLRQQYNYGRAEAMLAAKWPEKFNAAGHVRWSGRIYGSGRATPAFPLKFAVYQGTWGSAAFQSIYQGNQGIMSSLTMMPEWHLVVAALLVTSLLGLLWAPFFLALVGLIPALGLQLAQSLRGAAEAHIPADRLPRDQRIRARLMIAVLHYLQPLTRLRGRVVQGLRPWRFSLVPLSIRSFKDPWFWYETWASKETRLEALEARLHEMGAKSNRGGDYDDWDLEVLVGLAGCARVLMAIEEHGGGRQLVRYRIQPRFSQLTNVVLAVGAVIGVVVWVGDAHTALQFLFGLGLLTVASAVIHGLSAAGAIRSAAEAAGESN